MNTQQQPATDARICVCVLMNHPYPANLPLLRRLYRGRFSELLFLVPFARIDDPDVITTYRGSYTHAAYITDALARLAQVSCDHFLFVHDDVLLNPKLDESNFRELFPLASDEAFIPFVQATPDKLGDWEWYYSFLPRLLHPKSLMFGTGIEPDNLLRYLPDAVAIREGFRRSGAPFTEQVEIDVRESGGAGSQQRSAERNPSTVLLDGLAARLDHESPAQQTVDTDATAALCAITTLLNSARQRGGSNGTSFDLPFPLATSGFYTDCYILPRTQLETFAHYMGIAGAAGLFVEIVVPVLLHALCARVHTAATLSLDFAGFRLPIGMEAFVDSRQMGIHPFKFSRFRAEAQHDAFCRMVNDLRAGGMFSPADVAIAELSPELADPARYVGWHRPEQWGRWAAQRIASMTVFPQSDEVAERIRVRLTAPVSAEVPTFSGSVAFEAHPPICFATTFPQKDVEVTVDMPLTGPDGHRLVITSDDLIIPRNLHPDSPDHRKLGIGLRGIERL